MQNITIKGLTYSWFAEYPFIEGAERDASTLRERGYLTKITIRSGFRQLWYRHSKVEGRHPKTDEYGRL